MAQWHCLDAVIVPGHQVASGANGNPRFPGGTLQMQTPFFLERGLNLGEFHRGTINVSIAPLRYRVLKARCTFRNVKWHPTEPAEDFSFFDVRLLRTGKTPVAGLVYFPHPETKPAHFQQADVLELLFPFIPDLGYGRQLKLEMPEDQMLIGSNDADGS